MRDERARGLKGIKHLTQDKAVMRRFGLRRARVWPVVVIVALAWPLITGTARAERAGPGSAPSVPGCYVAREQLLSMLGNVSNAKAHSYTSRDNTGYTIDTIKIVPIAGGYLGVYHINNNWNFAVRLGYSSDLIHWTYMRTLAWGASQPTMYAMPGGGLLVAYEKDDAHSENLEFRFYASVADLEAGTAAGQFDAPDTLSTLEGTPSIQRVTGRTIAASTIQVGFHYYDTLLGVDRNAVGTLTNFLKWTARPNVAIDSAFHPTPGGNIGGRDYVNFMGCPFTLVEAQSIAGNWGSWRVYLYDDTARTMTEIPVRTAGGSTSFGNPKVTVVTDPSGRPALVVSYFVFDQDVGPGEAGPLVFYTEFSRTQPGGGGSVATARQAAPRTSARCLARSRLKRPRARGPHARLRCRRSG